MTDYDRGYADGRRDAYRLAAMAVACQWTSPNQRDQALRSAKILNGMADKAAQEAGVTKTLADKTEANELPR